MSDGDEAPDRDAPKDSDPPKAGADAPHAEERDAKDLGREFSAQAAQPGAARQRLGTEHDAIANFSGATVTARHAAGQNMTINYYTSSDEADAIKLVKLTAEALDEARDLFVEPEGFAGLRAAIESHRLLFVRAEADRGKYLAAQRLLLGCAGVYRLHPETRLGAIPGSALEKGGGYILVDLPGQAARELTTYDLTTLASALEDNDARLVVTVPLGRRFRAPEVAKLLHDLGRVTDWAEILRLRLERRLGGQATLEVADDEALGLLIEEEARRHAAPAHAALLAELAADAYERDEPIAETVREGLAAYDETAFDAWAESLPDLPTQSMALAIAVLGGEPYETVSAAADALQQRSARGTVTPVAMQLPAGAEPGVAIPRSVAPLMARKKARLQMLRAHVVPSTVRTRHGGAPTEVVRFRDPGYHDRYLRYFWNEYDDARPMLLAWLRTCARHELESVRVRAAVATGMLTARSFDHVRALVVEPWAADDDGRLRHAAAIALGSAASTEPELRPSIRNLVRYWSLEGSAELQATAARSWRVVYEAAGPDAALKALEELSEADDSDVTLAICTSLTELWEVEGEPLDAPACLLRWLKKPARKQTARLAFLFAAADLVRPVNGVGWPSLLYLSAVDPTRFREIGALWWDALTAPRLHPYAKEILAEWAYGAEHEPLLRTSLTRLLASAADDRVALIVAHEAGKWATGSRRAPAVSAAVRTALSTRRR